MQDYIRWFNQISYKDVPLVGGKNASLGEMLSQLGKKGINVPDGFALTSQAYWHFLKENKLEEKLKKLVVNLKRGDVKSLQETGKAARQLIFNGKFPKDLKKEILSAYKKLEKKYGRNYEVAVRSSGVAEDAPTDSFAGQFETFLNVNSEEKLLEALRKCLASSFNDRVIAYREEKNISHLRFALSIGVQKMVRSDLASSGIIFTLDTESGFPDVVLINSVFGVGEMIVQGKITPDEFYVHKPTLEKGFKPVIIKNLGRKTKKYIFAEKGGLKEVEVPLKSRSKFSLQEEEILTLARWAIIIEKHYKRPQDIEWAKDGKSGQLFIVQARPETVFRSKKENFYQEYNIETGQKPILKGTAIGNKIGCGKVRIISAVSQISKFQKGEVLVTKMTDPDWLPIMRTASAIITDEGGKTCHSAIVARELGIPAIVGTEKGSKVLKNGQEVTVDCTSGEGRIFKGKIAFKVKKYDLKKIPRLETKIMINIGAPEIAFKTSFLPNDGVGLARQEFIIAEKIRVHPLALYHFKKIKDKKLKKEIEEITREHKDKKEHFVKELAEGVAQIAAAFFPKPVIIRFSDLKTNEYRTLLGGEIFEPSEENPMIGWRGACRYLDKEFQPAFQMECQAIKRCRDIFGLKNIWLMVPFCRTVEEGKMVLGLMKKNGLERGKNDLKIIVMCEIPSNVILADKFLEIFDGMSIGSNDLTQLVLGMDRDNAKISHIGNEKNEAVKEMVSRVIKICGQKNKYCGICGQAPSDFPEFAEFLVEEKIESISLNPDTVIKTISNLAKLRYNKKGQKG